VGCPDSVSRAGLSADIEPALDRARVLRESVDDRVWMNRIFS